MLKLDLTNLEKISTDHGLQMKDLEISEKELEQMLEKVKSRGQGFYEILDDNKTLEEIESYAKKVEGKFSDIVVLGIGGSALGTICIKEALKPTSKPNLHVLDNIDPQYIHDIEKAIDIQNTLFIVVTKSGSTPETIALYSYFREKLAEPTKQMVFVTDPQKGPLRKTAEKEGFESFAVPPNVGGRFSVLTPVGLLPAALIGLNIRQLIEGAKLVRKAFFNSSYQENAPYQIAKVLFELYQKGKFIQILMPYSNRLSKLADWYKQLLAESIGKEKNRAGETVNIGITPVNALGVTDQHSQTQLYNAGPNDKILTYLVAENMGPKIAIPNMKPYHFGELAQIEQKATAQALNEYQKPNFKITIEQIDENNLGQLFFLFESTIALLGEMFKINAYDQPGVELSKDLTRKALAK